MKSFYDVAAEPIGAASGDSFAAAVSQVTRARVAIYDGVGSAPRVEEIVSPDVDEYIEALSSRVYELARERGGEIPYTVIREVSENLIHADFAEPVVSILDDGATVRFADQGPGIADKSRALLPGFTTARSSMKRHIRGVGSGFPIVKDYLSLSGGELTIEDNLGCGSVVTVHSKCARSRAPHQPRPAAQPRPSAAAAQPFTPPMEIEEPVETSSAPVARPRLSTRQKQVLALVMESGTAGPSLVAAELGVALSTAYRDLASLEDMGLILADAGKRQLTEDGLDYLKDMTSGY